MIDQIFGLEPKPMSYMARANMRTVKDGLMVGATPYVEREHHERPKHQPTQRIPTTFKVLDVLQDSGKAWTMSEIARELGLSVAVVCTALGKLVKAGDVERLPTRIKHRLLFRCVKR